ncbi:3'(2'),5'-bisphosphate nucleotidase CysQ [Rhizobium halophytocola]|uniref:3'(2'),5'-bisphosphate nucleotidase CysQ n=1 Tax=Rhizobium halophytocola TaxID=735519 RepID=A0ABS4DT54_9HYPH|nr:3'(2'),5'-bisphosphate nucleotidase CysQ [Rhizobium halophytocola]MBP1848873.1 3'(2'), 5'-bisphosphate nucleotidase [Rhizobium halophytocola]
MIHIFEKAALEAGRAILEVYEAGPNVTIKADSSPVTEADERAEAIILGILKRAFPGIPVVAEEAVAAGHIPQTEGQRFILVDPLDGTKEFINRRPDFTVNIALIEDDVPVTGIVYAPAKGVAYVGTEDGAQKLAVSADFTVTGRSEISARKRAQPPVAVASRSHNNAETEAFLKDNAVTDTRSVGSSLKFCLIAEGEADVYPRYGRTMEWDTAAGDAVLRAAGGTTVGLDGKPLPYGKRNQKDDSDFANPFFIAWGK